MKTYEKPIVLLNEELAEGVYAASGAEPENPNTPENPDTPENPGGGPDNGSEPTPDAGVTTDCWTVDAKSVQDWNGSHHVFEVTCKHSTDVVHISSQTEVSLTFSNTLTDAYSEFECSFGGTTATVTRTLHANAYKSGDTMTYKVWAKASDEATTKALTCTSAVISCTHAVNVQGGFD